MNTTKDVIKDALDPLTKYIHASTPPDIQTAYLALLKEVHRCLSSADRQLFWTRATVVVLGLMYLFK